MKHLNWDYDNPFALEVVVQDPHIDALAPPRHTQ